MSLIKKRINSAGRKQSELAESVATRAGENGPTVESRLSAIATPEGDAYFFGGGEKMGRRLAALSDELGIAESELRQLRDAPTLVLDPHLPAATRDFVVQAAGRTYDAIVVDSSRPFPLWEILRDQALSERNTIVVPSDLAQSKLFFNGAGVESSELVAVPRGYRLISRPDLIPIPPRPPTPSHDTNGFPLLRPEPFKKFLGNRWPHRLEQCALRAAQRDEDFVFTIHELQRDHVLSEVEFVNGAFWVKESSPEMVDAFSPHPVKSWRLEAQALVKGRNPFRMTTESKPTDFGPSELDTCLANLIRDETSKFDINRIAAVAIPPAERTADLSANVRNTVKAFLSREIAAGVPRSAPRENLARFRVPHVLSALMSARLVVADDGGVTVGTADWGTGLLAYIRLAKFSDPAGALILREVTEVNHRDLIDGGDAVLSLRFDEVPALWRQRGNAAD